MTQEKLNEVLRKHKLWLAKEDGGEKANLREADLRRADLRRADLRRADLKFANLQGANLEGSNLREADLRGADLREANLQRANLQRTNLRDADLEEANLEGADLRYAPNFSDTQGNLPAYQASCGFGSRNSTLTLLALGEEKDWQFFTGCFRGTKEALIEAVEEKHKGVVLANYMLAINYLINLAQGNKQLIENQEQ